MATGKKGNRRKKKKKMTASTKKQAAVGQQRTFQHSRGERLSWGTVAAGERQHTRQQSNHTGKASQKRRKEKKNEGLSESVFLLPKGRRRTSLGYMKRRTGRVGEKVLRTSK